jgi:glucose/arabinose dehydrogenase
MYRSSAFIGEHGSWNRIPFSGYKVVFVPFVEGKPSGQPIDVLTGFLSAQGKAQEKAEEAAQRLVGSTE